jgi:hypothetical protein
MTAPKRLNLVQRLTAAVLKRAPLARCLSCLAAELRISGPTVRDAAQALILREKRFHLQFRICSGCSRNVETLVLTRALHADRTSLP